MITSPTTSTTTTTTIHSHTRTDVTPAALEMVSESAAIPSLSGDMRVQQQQEAQEQEAIEEIPKSNTHETAAIVSPPIMCTTTAAAAATTTTTRSVPQRQCNRLISTRHLSRLDHLFWKTDQRNRTTDPDVDPAADTTTTPTIGGPMTRKRKLSTIPTSSTAAGTISQQQQQQQHGRLLLQRVHDSPHIYMIDNFLTETEIAHLHHSIIQQQQHGAFQKSFVDAPETTSSTSTTTTTSTSTTLIDTDHRTSTFVSISKQADRIISGLERKAADLLGLTVDRIEPLQLVRYQVDQFFGAHHDLGTLVENDCDNDDDDGDSGDGDDRWTVELPPKAAFVKRRIATLFCYLNTVEQGGCTQFPALGHGGSCSTTSITTGQELRVAPVRGRAVLFCNVLKSGHADPRTIHAGEPVKGPKGAVKYGLNIWACEE